MVPIGYQKKKIKQKTSFDFYTMPCHALGPGCSWNNGPSASSLRGPLFWEQPGPKAITLHFMMQLETLGCRTSPKIWGWTELLPQTRPPCFGNVPTQGLYPTENFKAHIFNGELNWIWPVDLPVKASPHIDHTMVDPTLKRVKFGSSRPNRNDRPPHLVLSQNWN